MTTLRRTAPIAAWILALVAVLVGLGAAGHGVLAGPGVADPGSWSDWAGGRPAEEVLMVALRLLATALAWYLLAVTLLGVVLRVVRAGRLVRLADLVTVPFVRSLMQAGVGAGMTGLLVAVSLPGAAAAGASPAERPPLVLVAPGVGESAPPVMQKLDPAPAAVPVPAPEPAAARVWTVAAGEHLWSISGQVLALAWGRAPSDAEVGTYWGRLVEQNRGALADPDNPDLIFPGQELAVPAPPPAA